MQGLDNKILEDFINESKTLVLEMQHTLEKCEGNFKQVKSLEHYARGADRIMGAAKSLAFIIGAAEHPINKVSDYAAICKIVGNKSALIENNSDFYNTCVALLIDGTEVLAAMIDALETGEFSFNELISNTLVARLKWISTEFGQEFTAVDIHKGQNTQLNQNDIDDLLKKLGFD